jgi:hypothetical protein
MYSARISAFTRVIFTIEIHATVDGDVPSAADIAEPIQKIGAECGNCRLGKIGNIDRIHLGWRLQQ